MVGAPGFEPGSCSSPLLPVYKTVALPLSYTPLVRVDGFEPPTSCSQNRRATTALHSDENGTTGEIRTHTPLTVAGFKPAASTNSATVEWRARQESNRVRQFWRLKCYRYTMLIHGVTKVLYWKPRVESNHGRLIQIQKSCH